MSQLKPISKEGIPVALEKAQRYRFLNEPRLAESICLDILAAEPENHDALVTLLLSITDQFGRTYASADVHEARNLLPRLKSEYERLYFEGIISERKGKAILSQGNIGANFHAYDWLRKAMDLYEKAESLRPAGNDDAILRWNTCVRLIERNHLEPRKENYVEPPLE